MVCSVNYSTINLELLSTPHSGWEPLSNCSLSLCNFGSSNITNSSCLTPSASCFDYRSRNNTSYCAPGAICSLMEPCNMTGECSTNTSVCVINSCCASRKVCLPLQWISLCSSLNATRSTPKLWYNDTCFTSSYCDESRGLDCDGLGGRFFQRCNCYNNTFIWDAIYTYVNRTFTCVPKKRFNQTGCVGDLECDDAVYLICNNGTCECAHDDYWDGSRCQIKRNYTEPCTNSSECRDFSPVNLVCRNGTTSPSTPSCLCPVAPGVWYWNECLQQCAIAHSVRKTDFD